MHQYIDEEKVELEKDNKLNLFIDLLIENQEFLPILYDKRNKFKKFLIPINEDLNLDNFLKIAKDLCVQSSYIEEIYHLIYELFKDYLNSSVNLKKIFHFLNLAVQYELLAKSTEYLYYCVDCHCYFITNKRFYRCNCNEKLISFSFAVIPDIIKKSIQNGHIIEHLVLNFLKMNDVKLIGIEYNYDEIFTSIQYSGIGAGEKNNAEFDLIALKDFHIIFIECKFNLTTFSDIKDFLISTDNFIEIIKTKYNQYGMRRILITQDKSKLKVPPEITNLKIIELQNDKLIKILQNL